MSGTLQFDDEASRRAEAAYLTPDVVEQRRATRAALALEPGEDVLDIGRVLAAWDEHLIDPHLPRRLTGLLSAAGFSVVRRAAIPLLNAGYDPNSFSAGLIGFISGFVPGRQGLSERDARDWAEDLEALGDDYFFSLNRYVFLALK